MVNKNKGKNYIEIYGFEKAQIVLNKIRNSNLDKKNGQNEL